MTQDINSSNINESSTDSTSVVTPPTIDENLSIFVYGSIVIRDVETDTILIKKSF